MAPPKRIGRFFLITVVVYAALMAPWPGLAQAYAAVFRAEGNLLFSRSFWFWADGRVRFIDLNAGDQIEQIKSVFVHLPETFEPLKPEGVKDTLMVMTNRAAPASVGFLRTSSRYVGYGPTVVIIALVLATPLAWKKRAWALVWGLVLTHVFIAMRVTLTLLVNGFAADKDYALFEPGSFLDGSLLRIESIFADDPTVSFVVPAIIWLVVAVLGRRYTGDILGSVHTKTVERTAPPVSPLGKGG